MNVALERDLAVLDGRALLLNICLLAFYTGLL